MLEDTPRSIALGTAIGAFIGLTPTVGLQMILVVFLAVVARRLFRFNRMAALVTVYISNPITVVPIYYVDYLVGRLFFGGTADWQTFTEVLGWNSTYSWSQKLHWLFVEVGAPLVFGSLVVGTVGAALTYPAMLWLVRTVRGERRHGAVSAQGEELAPTTGNQ